ncbi:MAG: hypothetical protein Ct9H300mP1_32730 [Planctomycetaceae bacterium]|nr:MAG: hypothetical protein Ct9H300mP1_32730 [Planctomycetaceae bacterium]
MQDPSARASVEHCDRPGTCWTFCPARRSPRNFRRRPWRRSRQSRTKIRRLGRRGPVETWRAASGSCCCLSHRQPACSWPIGGKPHPTDHLIQQLSVVERWKSIVTLANLTSSRACRNRSVPPHRQPGIVPLEPIPETSEGRWTYVAKLPSDRRRQLKKNLEDFDNLAGPRRLKLEQLDHQVTEKEKLAKIAADFHNWTKTLQPWQRDELRKQRAGASSKVELVVKYLDEKKGAEANRGASWPVPFGNRKSPVLDSADFTKVIKVISDRLPPMIKAATGEQRRSPGNRHALRVIELSTSSGRPRSGDRPFPRPPDDPGTHGPIRNWDERLSR